MKPLDWEMKYRSISTKRLIGMLRTNSQQYKEIFKAIQAAVQANDRAEHDRLIHKERHYNNRDVAIRRLLYRRGCKKYWVMVSEAEPPLELG